jgi:hypothetical protein
VKPRTYRRLSATVDFALVFAVAAWVGIAAAFLASLTPPPSTSPAVSASGAFPRGGWVTAGEPSSRPETNQTMHTPVQYIIDARFLAALAAVESGGDDSAVNEREDAHGRFQIRAAALADANRILCTDYTLADCHDPAVAVRVVRAYLGHYGASLRAPTPDALARIWNGGPNGYRREATRGYAERFHRAYLEARRV